MLKLKKTSFFILYMPNVSAVNVMKDMVIDYFP